MFRIVGVICEIWAVIAFLLAIVVIFYIYTLTLDISLPTDYLTSMDKLLTPFISPIRASFGIHYTVFKNHQIEMSYGFLSVICLALVALLMAIASVFYKMDQRLSKISRFMSHSFFQWRIKQSEKGVTKTVSGKIYVPETAALLAIGTENLYRYPKLEQEVQRKLYLLRADQRVFNEDGKVLLRFKSTSQAIQFAKDFCAFFKKAASMLPEVFFEEQPEYRIALESLKQESDFYDAERYIWSLLNFVGAYQVYVSGSAKEQFDMQKADGISGESVELIPIGDFSTADNRTFSNVFRLHTDRWDISEVS